MTDRMPAVLLAVSGAAIALIAVILLHLGGGISEREETRVFMLACILVPISGVGVAAIFDALKRRFFKESTLYYPLLALANAILWIFLVRRLREALPPPETGAHIDLQPLFRKLLFIWPASNVAVVSFIALTQKQRWSVWLGPRLAPWVERAVPFLVFYALLPFTMHTPPTRWKVVALLVGAGIASLVHRELSRFPRPRAARIAIDLLVLVAIALVVIDPAGDVNVEHHNFYLGPAAAARAGKSLLVDVNCQYGVGIIYLLSSLLRFGLMTPSMYGFALIVGAFSLLQYTVWYGTLRMITRSVALPALVILVAVMVATFEQAGSASEYPSTGGIRFLPGFLFVGCLALKARFPRQKERFLTLEALVVGGSAIWSFESFVYVLVAYLGSVVYDTAHAKRGAILASLRKRLAPTLIAMAGWHIWLLAFTRYRSGEWPHWSHYLDFIRLYSVGEFGTLPIEPWTPWLIIAGVYGVALTALAYRRLAEEKKSYRPELGVVFAMASLGVGQFTYFLGRSHVNNLFHICLPAFFVAGYGFIRAAKDVDGVSSVFRRSFVFVCYGALALCFFSAVAETAGKVDHTALAYLITDRKAKDPPASRRVQDLVDLVQYHAPNQRLVALFSGADVEVQVFLMARKANLYPIGYQLEDTLLTSAKERIYKFDDHLKAGDLVFIDTGTRAQPDPKKWDLATDVDAIDKRLWDQLSARFAFEVVDSRKGTGIFVLRLIPR